MSTAHSASDRRTTAERALSMMRLSARKTLEPLLKPAAQDAVQAVEFDLSLSSAIKVSARNMLVGFRAFSDAFFAALDREMQSAVADLLADRESAAEPAGPRGRLSLVEYEQMEEQTVVIRVATRLRNAADQEYASLTRRIARVVRRPGLGDRDNPFHPLRYCRALGDAVDKLGFKGDERHAIVKAFEVPLRKPLVDVYAGLNGKLEAQGVTDEEAARYNAVKAPVRATAPAGREREPQPATTAPSQGGERARAEAFPSADRAPAATPPDGPASRSTALSGSTIGSTSGAPHPTAPSGPTSSSSAEQLLAALFQRMQLKRVASAGAAVPTVPPLAMPDAHELLGPSTRGFAGTPPAPVLPNAQAAGVAAKASAGVPVQFAGIDPALLASINEVQRLNALAAMTGRTSAARALLARDEQNHRQQVADRATRPIDKLTVELVGMVFDRIQQDDAIPAPIKAALSRLQFPVMKVALSDADVFVTPSQPARRLMDRIAGTAIGWHPDGEQNTRYLAEVNKAINTVLLAINEGPAIFDRALHDFEAFLDDEERCRDDEPVTRARQAIEEAEQREAMAVSAAAGLRRAFDGMQVDAYLREFLLDDWVKVLVAAGVRERAEPGLARRYQEAASDLIWSVQPKLEPEDRKRLVKTIPAVLNTLREGLQLIDVPFSSMRPFFTQLMASHAQATKAGEIGAAGPTGDATARGRNDAVSLELTPGGNAQEPYELAAQMLRAAVAAHQADINVVEEAAEPPPDEPVAAGALSDKEIDATIDGWQRGSWFDLWTGEGTERVQLRWVSPRRHFYLFTSAANGRAHSIAPAILRGYVRLGRIAPAEKAPLFERVVGHLLRDLQCKESALAV